MTWYLGQRVRVHAKVLVMRGGLDSLDTWKVEGISVAAEPQGLDAAERESRRTRWLLRDERNMPAEGVLIGRTHREVGMLDYTPWNDGGYPAYVEKPVKVTVYLVATTLRWRQPLDVLEADIEALD